MKNSELCAVIFPWCVSRIYKAWKDACTVCSSIVYHRQDMRAAQASLNRWMDKNVVRMCSGILLSHKKKDILPFAATWMDWEGIVPGEIHQAEKDKRTQQTVGHNWATELNWIWYHLHFEILKIQQTNEYSNKKKESPRYRKQIGGYQWGERRGEGQDRGREEVQAIMYKNKLQGYTAQDRKYSQYSRVTIDGVKTL